MNNETALITRASSGTGLHLAYECAAHGQPLVVVAPVSDSEGGPLQDRKRERGDADRKAVLNIRTKTPRPTLD